MSQDSAQPPHVCPWCGNHVESLQTQCPGCGRLPDWGAWVESVHAREELRAPPGWEGLLPFEPLGSIAEVAGYLRRELAALRIVGEKGRGPFWLEQANQLHTNVFRAIDALRIFDRPQQQPKANDCDEAELRLAELWRWCAAQGGNAAASAFSLLDRFPAMPAVVGSRDASERSRVADLASMTVIVATAGDLWKALDEGKKPAVAVSEISIGPPYGSNILQPKFPQAADQTKADVLERALAICDAEGGNRGETMRKLIARVALAKGVDRRQVINMPLAEFVAAATGGNAPAVWTSEDIRDCAVPKSYTIGSLLNDLIVSHSTYKANMREAERLQQEHGFVVAHHMPIQAGILKWSPDRTRMPGIDRIELMSLRWV